jgi:aryl-alcohol dehydrogenase-like predicted oxidoreductase
MKYNVLGKTGLKVSELCLGTMTFGGREVIGNLGQDEANELVARALDAGINFFDTADAYSRTQAEVMLGKALGSRRSEVVIATKVRIETGPGPNDLGLSRGHILSAVDASLRRLGTDYIDLYQVHLPDKLTPLEETLRALDDVVRWGKVRYIGVSNFPAWMLMKALGISDKNGWARFVSLQAHYTLIERSLEREIIPALVDQGLGLMIWSPLAGGFLSGKVTREGDAPDGSRRASFDFPPIVNRDRAFDVVDVMREVASEQGISVARIGLAWLLHQPAVSSVIIGAKRPDQLDDNLKAVDVRLTDDQRKRLDGVSALSSEYPGWMLEYPWDDRI